MRELCDIQVISICSSKYYESLIERYRIQPEEAPEIPVMKPNTIDFSKDSVAARNAMFAVFGSARKPMVH